MGAQILDILMKEIVNRLNSNGSESFSKSHSKLMVSRSQSIIIGSSGYLAESKSKRFKKVRVDAERDNLNKLIGNLIFYGYISEIYLNNQRMKNEVISDYLVI